MRKSHPALPASDLIIMLFHGQAAVIVFVYNQVNWSSIKGWQIKMILTGLSFPFVRMEHLHYGQSFFALFPCVKCNTLCFDHARELDAFPLHKGLVYCFSH